MEEQANHLIYAFPRGLGEEVQISIREFKGKHYVDLRVWFQAKNETCFRPTKKGVFFSVGHVEEFRKGVDRLIRAAERFRTEEAAVVRS
jgi:hypothetical protein